MDVVPFSFRMPSSSRSEASLAGVDARLRRHAGKVQRVTRQLQTRLSTRPLRFLKKAVSHEVPKARDLKYEDEAIDISDFDEVLSIDPVNRVCVAESGVTFFQLVNATMAYGLVPMIVPELKTITIGGAVAGCSVESMSFRYGGFHDTCLEYEVITARGEVVTCTADNENQLLFQMVHGTFGTLGILSKLTFRLLPAKPFVHVTYARHATFDAFAADIRRHFEAQDVEFMDGIIHSPAEWVLSTGRFVDKAPYANHYDWMKVYFRSTRKRDEDYLRTPDYFFRYDRGVTTVRPKSVLGRLFFGKFVGSSQILRAADTLHRLLPLVRLPFTLDVFVPFSKADEFMKWYQKTFAFFPLWCVPYRARRRYEWLSKQFFERSNDELFLDFAIYGMHPEDERRSHELMEQKLLEIGGMKTLISQNYYSEEDFWKTWNKENYDAVKARTDPENVFRDLYSKTCRRAMGLPG